jgi:hypothetical protein
MSLSGDCNEAVMGWRAPDIPGALKARTLLAVDARLEPASIIAEERLAGQAYFPEIRKIS